MALQFQRVVEDMEIWSANSEDYSFVISFFERFAGPGFHKRPGFMASWRPNYRSSGAVKIIGSPFESFDAAEVACETMLKQLMYD